VNLFILDRHPENAVRFYNDFHVRKIILEAVQMMGYAYYNHGDGFKPLPWLFVSKQGMRHYNHPMSIWVRRSKQNFDWTLRHTQGLLTEFAHRQKENRPHAYVNKVAWIESNLPMAYLSDFGQTDWPRCFGFWKEKIELSDDAVYDYRRYYMLAKRHIAVWTRRPIPEWWR
jgi:hypothetical protein